MSLSCYRDQSGVIYVDAAIEPGKTGIGVYSDDFGGIRIAQEFECTLTVNAAECFALDVGLEYCLSHQITQVLFLSDSQCVVGWVTQYWRQESDTARKYVPTLVRKLRQVQGRVEWVTGKQNPADSLSRSRFPKRDLSFDNVRRAKCGRDEFSKLRLEQLKDRCADWELLAKAIRDIGGNDSELAVALRWRLRGWRPEFCVRKVVVNRQMAVHKKQQWREDDEG